MRLDWIENRAGICPFDADEEIFWRIIESNLNHGPAPAQMLNWNLNTTSHGEKISSITHYWLCKPKT